MDILTIIRFPALESTQDMAKKIAASATSRTVIVAETQTGARGRMKRERISPPGGLWMTGIIHGVHAYLPIIVGASLVDAIENLGARVRLKRPNDVVSRAGRKIAGVLIEVLGDTSLIGIGVNVNNPIPPKIRDVAVSIKELVGHEVDRMSLLTDIRDNIYNYLHNPFGALERRREKDYLKNKRVRVYVNKHKIEGIARGIDEDGFLLVETEKGTERIISAYKVEEVIE